MSLYSTFILLCSTCCVQWSLEWDIWDDEFASWESRRVHVAQCAEVLTLQNHLSIHCTWDFITADESTHEKMHYVIMVEAITTLLVARFWRHREWCARRGRVSNLAYSSVQWSIDAEMAVRATLAPRSESRCNYTSVHPRHDDVRW